MLAQHMPWPSVYLLCALAGAGAVLAVQHLVLWYNNRQGAAALWLGALSASLAAQMGVTAWVLKAAPDQFNEAMFVRVLLNALAIVLFVPTAAAFSGRAWPRWSMGLLVTVAVAYVVLWGTTDLVYAHRLSPDAVPVYALPAATSKCRGPARHRDGRLASQGLGGPLRAQDLPRRNGTWGRYGHRRGVPTGQRSRRHDKCLLAHARSGRDPGAVCAPIAED